MQKILTFSQNASRIPGNDARNSSQLKNCALDLGPARRVDDREAEAAKTTTVLTTAMRRRGDPRLAGASLKRSYFRTGAPTTLDSQVVWICFRVPFAFSCASAPFTQAASGLPFADHAEVLAARLRRQLAEDLAVRHLHRSDVEGGRQVDDERVDLLRS